MFNLYKHNCIFLILISFIAFFQSHATNNPAYVARQQAYRDSALAHFNSNAITIQAYAGLPVDSASISQIIASFPHTGTNDFRLEMLVRVLCLQPGVYDSAILPSLRPLHYWINNDDTLDCYWTENHMIQWMSTHWLLHERYGIPADSTLRKRLVHFLQMKLTYNYFEFFSTTYNPYALCGLLNLADFAQDTVVKNLSVKAAQLLMKDILVMMNDKGVIYPAAGRNYPLDYENPYGGDATDITWMLTGIGQKPGGASHGGGFLATSSIYIDSVTQTWQPALDTTIVMGGLSLNQSYAYNSYQDSIDQIIFQWSASAVFNPENVYQSAKLISDSALWRNIVYQPFHALSGLPLSILPSIASQLSSASYSSILYNDTVVVFKHKSVTLSSVQNYWPGYWGYEQYPCVANIENTAVYTASGAIDSIWDNRNHHNGNDDLPYVKQVKNVALEMYWPLPKSTILTVSNPAVALHWNNAAFTEVRNDSLWLLGRVNNNYVGVKRSCIGMTDGLWACNPTQNPGQGWVIIVGDSDLYGSFNNFQVLIDSSKYTEQWYYDSTVMQEKFFAQIIIDGDTINHLWGRDSAMVTGIQALIPDANGISLYPNPSNSIINIALRDLNQGEVIDIYNMLGELIYHEAATKENGINVAQWSEGMYAVRVSSQSGTFSKCFIVSH